jgi:hypothetical protein
MPGYRDWQLISRDATSIVTHPYQTNATALDIDLDATRASIQAVLDELLDDGRRPLDDLACGDLVNELAGEDTDWHNCSLARHWPRIVD